MQTLSSELFFRHLWFCVAILNLGLSLYVQRIF